MFLGHKMALNNTDVCDGWTTFFQTNKIEIAKWLSIFFRALV